MTSPSPYRRRRFDGSRVWITGGGSGLGEAMALEFARHGAHVAVSGRRRERLEGVVRVVEAVGVKGLAVPCDVTQEDDLEAAVAMVTEAFGGLDVVVANAGMSISGAIDQLGAAEWRRQLDTNVVGLALTIRQALPHLRATRGRLALVGSVASMICAPGFAPYHASKYAVRAIGQTVAMELHGSGVSCTTIHPGYVESEIAKVDNQGTFDPNRTDTRPQSFMWKTEDAARVMVRAIHKRKREFTFTFHGRLGAWLGRHAPGLVHFVMTRSGSRKRLRGMPKAGEPGA